LGVRFGPNSGNETKGRGRKMPEERVVERANQDKEEGKSPSTQAGEFVREEIHHIRERKHGARSPQQIIAIGLSKARRAGVKLPPPGRGKTSERTRAQARHDLKKGRMRGRKTSRARSRATAGALKRESRAAASHASLARQARTAAKRRGRASRHRAAVRAIHTKGKAGLQRAARKAARSRNAK
jgi:hypothetical protein